MKTLREIAPDRELICLFGCGGDRDKTKRPEMAAIAQKLADRIIVTADNSRTERTADIMAAVWSSKSLAFPSGDSYSICKTTQEQASAAESVTLLS